MDHDRHETLQHQGVPVMTFKQLDRLNGVPKGTSFRAFKRVRSELREGVDYFHLTESNAPELVAQLREREQTYLGPPGVVLITEAGYRRMRSARP